ncbi:MAG: hypothetical protein ACYSW0_11625, partial [Planctomycetota bacterium]
MKTIRRIETNIIRFAFVTLLIGLAPALSGTIYARRTKLGDQIRQHCAEREISGGILVYLGNPDQDLRSVGEFGLQALFAGSLLRPIFLISFQSSIQR